MMKKLLCTILFTILATSFVYAQADINIQGNGVTIVNGDTTPDVVDDTDFGQVNVGSSSTVTYTIQNTGTADLFISLPPELTGSSDFAVTSNPAFQIPAAGSSTFDVQFSPTVIGVVTATVSITSSDPDENPYTFDIQGEGVTPTGPDINIQGNSITIVNGDTTPDVADDTDFGQVNVGSSSTVTYTIQNTGTTDLFISLPPGLTGSSDFAVTSNPTFQIPASGSSTFDVQFSPSDTGVVTATIAVSSSDPDENPYTFDIQGEGIPINEPDITVLGNGVTISDGDTTPSVADDTDYGQVATGSSLTRTFTIENEGTQTLFIGIPPTLTGSSDFAVTSNPAFQVDPGTSTTFDIEFTPSATGIVTATVSIASNDPDTENPYTFDIQAEGIVVTNPDINVQGNGVDIADGDTTPSVADDTDFGAVATGATATRTYTIQNTGDANLFVSPPTITGSSDFTVTVNPAFQVNPSASTTFTVEFAPSSIGTISATVSIASNDPDAENPYTFDILGEGAVPNEPEMDVFGNGVEITDGDTSPSTVDDTDFGQQNVSSGSVSNTFTIQNNGTIDLNLTDPNPFVTISGADAGDFILTVVPSTPIAVAASTTFTISFDPSAIGIRTATVSIANDDSDENPYTFDIQGEGIDANAGSPLLITQYYEGTGSNQWIEVKNVSTNTVTAGSFFLALYTNLNTITSVISTTAPQQSIAIPAMTPGQVLIFNNASTTLPSAGNLGGTGIPTNVCTFDGNDVILISTTNDAGCYNARIDIVGVVGTTTPPFWGQDTSFIKGCGNTESPTTTFDYTNGTNTVNDYTVLTIADVDNADTATNIALGTQTVGSTIYTSSWSNGLPDKTKEAIIAGTYNATTGSFEACNLTVSGTLNMNGGTTNFVRVNENLAITGSFTIGDTESLVTVNESASITGSITKLESSTPLNNFRDFTYWSSPVQGANIGTVFSGVDPNRIFQWQEPSSGSFGAWLVASGTMINAKGYISEAPSGAAQHNISFSGTPNNGVIGKSLGFDPTNTGNGGGFNLIGNPYPSAINADTFINEADNSELDGTIWLWTHNTAIVDNPGIDMDFTVDDYATYNLSGGTAATSGGAIPTGNIGSAQGFFVRALSAGTAFFNNPMRLDGQNNQFFRGSGTKKSLNEEKDRIWLDITSNEGGAFNQILIGFFDKATDGFDRGYDGLKFNGGNYISFYSKIGEDRYAIQGLGSYSSDKQVSLGLDTYITQTFKISISQIEGILKTEEVYLVDNELGIVHDLKTSDYEFEITETGFYTDRFTLQFNKSVLGVNEEVLDNDFLVINDNGTLRLRSNSSLTDVKVYDMLGRKLIDVQPNVRDYPLETGHISRGTVLIINAVLENGAKASKKSIRY